MLQLWQVFSGLERGGCDLGPEDVQGLQFAQPAYRVNGGVGDLGAHKAERAKMLHRGKIRRRAIGDSGIRKIGGDKLIVESLNLGKIIVAEFAAH